MRIRVYQVDGEKDRLGLKFRDYNTALKKAGRIDPSIYRTVYDGQADCRGLEDVFMMLNRDPPLSFRGHSMSVSDVAEVVEMRDGEEEPGFYYCDSVGFRRLDGFDPAECEPLRGRRMVIVEPRKPAYTALMGDSLEELQKAVGGYIEITYPFEDNAMVIGNEEAKLIGMEGNRRVNGAVYAGPMLIAADDGEGGTGDLTEEQERKYLSLFALPETITHEEVEADTGYYIMGLI